MRLYGILIKLGIELFDILTTSLDEFGAKADSTLKSQQELVSQSQKFNKEIDDLISKLITLNYSLNKTDSVYVHQIQILQILQSIYGDLGITVNATTKQVENLYQGLMKLNRMRHEEAIKQLQSRSLAAHSKSMTEMTKYLNESQYNEQLTSKNNWFKALIAPVRPLIDPLIDKFINDKFRRPVDTPITIGGLELAIQNLEQQLDPNNKDSKITTTAQSEAAQRLLQALKLQLKYKKQQASFKQRGSVDQKTLTARMNKTYDLLAQTERMTKNSENDFQKQKEFLDLRYKGQDAYNSNYTYTPRTPEDDFDLARETLAYTDQQFETAKVKQKQQADQYKRLLEELEAMKDKLDLTNPADVKTWQVMVAATNEASKKLVESTKELFEAEKNFKAAQEAYLKLRDADEMYIADRLKIIKQQLNIQQKILKCKFQQARLQKIINEAEARGITLSSSEAEKIDKMQAAVDKNAVKMKMNDKSFNLYLNALSKGGYEKHAFRISQYKQAFDINGKRPLSKTQMKQLDKLIDLEFRLRNLNLGGFRSRGTQTNELAARGGFASSVLKDNVIQVNKQILNQTKIANSLISQLGKIAARGNKIYYQN